MPHPTPRLIAIAVFVIACIAAVPGTLQLKVNPDATEDSLPKNGPRAELYDRYLDEFPPDYGGAVVLTGDVCTDEHLELLSELTAELEALPEVRQAVAITNAEYVHGVDDTVEVSDFPDVELEPGESRCELALNYPPYSGILISHDAEALAVFLAATEGVDAVTFTRAVEDVLQKCRSEFGNRHDIEIFQTGEMYGSTELSKLTSDSMRLLVYVLALMMAVAWVRTKSFVIGFLSVATGIASVFFTLSLMGYLGLMLNPVTAVVANMLTPLGTAFTVHAAVYVKREDRVWFGYLPHSALRPYGLATLTTMIGFGTTALTDAPQVRQMGLLGAFGIAACAFTAVTLTFPLLTLWSTGINQRTSDWKIPRALDLLIRMPRAALVGTLITLILVSALGVLRLRVDYGPIDYFTKENKVYQDIERGASYFGRYAIPATAFGSEADDALDPELWERINDFVDAMEEKYPGLRAAWMYDQLAELSVAFTADADEPLSFPDSPELISQFLILFDEGDVESYVDWDRKSLNILFQIPFRRSSEYVLLKQDVDAFRVRTGIPLHLTGRVASFFEEGEEIARDNLRSTWVGVGIVFVVFCALFRSPKLASLGILANVLPVFGVLAFLGLTGIPLDFGTSIVTAIALGLVLDDTGHLLARYYTYRTEGLPADVAVERSVSELWRPIVTTTLTTIIGFSVMNIADLVPFHTFSRLLSAAMLFALVGDLVILPSMLRHFHR